MKILFIHNKYGKTSGEEISIEKISALLQNYGHEVVTYYRSSEDIRNPLDYINAFFSNFYNRKSEKEIKELIKKLKPDLVQVQNIFPFISPPVLKSIKQMGVPIIMRNPNYRLFCPNGLFMKPSGMVCEKCTTPGKEIWGVINNCESNYFKSLTYSLRNYFVRKTGYISKNVDLYFVQSNFQKLKFISNGIPAEKLEVLPGFLPNFNSAIEKNELKNEYFLYIGRISFEKGIFDFIELANRRVDLDFAIAGKIPENIDVKIPKNIKCLGFLNESELTAVQKNAIALIIPSKCYEGFPNVVLQAMAMKLPIIASKIGVLSEIIEHGKTGVHFEPGNIEDLEDKVNWFLKNRNLINIMAENSSKVYVSKYNDEVIYKTLFNSYMQVIKKNNSTKIISN